MSYWEENLLDGETALHVTPVHWGVNIPGILLFLAGVGLLPFYWYVGMACLALMVIGGLYAYVRKISTELVVTTHRVIAKTGVVARHVVEINLEHLESVETDQSFTGRLFNCGLIRIVGTGGTPACVSFMEDPLAFRRAALQAKQTALEERRALSALETQ